ncbi:hypothetical protein PTTG_12445 [Puccinia triticina 1-1 BBBD Race 1]|uniref:Uncharacterized protein n=1 Tax=Puccinia triticina (isolate 1-1 / race 1 (BBBD)) TaxID=630390 RepID=A0A180G967_PUCT1|nr:hypothetical protein PTTG_12445 [Puccinia triticina 1-1 BBBD Race 1]WAR55783.1 hypothetical protein PtB15_6B526 [Puccinia triticina]
MLIKRLIFAYLFTFPLGECNLGQEAREMATIGSHGMDGGPRATAEGLGLHGANHDSAHLKGGLHASDGHSDSEDDMPNLLEMAKNEPPDAHGDVMDRMAANARFELPYLPHPDEWRIKTWWVENCHPLGRKMRAKAVAGLSILFSPLALLKSVSKPRYAPMLLHRIIREPIGVWEKPKPSFFSVLKESWLSWWSWLQNKLSFGSKKVKKPSTSGPNPNELLKKLRGPVKEEGAGKQLEEPINHHESATNEGGEHPKEPKDHGDPGNGQAAEGHLNEAVKPKQSESGTPKHVEGNVEDAEIHPQEPIKNQESPANAHGEGTEAHPKGAKEHEEPTNEEGAEDPLKELINPPESKWRTPEFPPIFSKDPVVAESYILGGEIKSIKEKHESLDPIQGNEHSSDPIKENEHSSDSIKENGHSSDPIKENGESSDPIKENGHSLDPIEENGHSSDPIKENGHPSDPIKDNDQPLNRIKNELMSRLYGGNPASKFSGDMAQTLKDYVTSDEHLLILERLYQRRNELLHVHGKMQALTNRVVSALGGEDATSDTFKQIIQYHKKINSEEHRIGDPERKADPSLYRKYTTTLTLAQLDPAAYKMHLSPLLYLEEVTRRLERDSIVGLQKASGYIGSTPRLEVLTSAAKEVEEYANLSREVDMLQNKAMNLRDHIPSFTKAQFQDARYIRNKFKELLTIDEEALNPKRFVNKTPAEKKN